MYYQSQQLEARVLAKQRPLRLPSVYLISPHVTKSTRPYPPYLHTASDQRLEKGLGSEATCLAYTVHVDQYLAFTLHMGQFGGYPSVCAPVLHICVPNSSAHGWLM